MNTFMKHVAACLAGTILASTAMADIWMPSVFSDHMVMQRDMPIAVWGTTTPGNYVHAELRNDTTNRHAGVFTRADLETGAWSVKLNPLELQPGSWTLTVIEYDTWEHETRKQVSSLEFKDVLVGEVWICGGQSNMEWVLDWIGTTPEQKKDMDQPRMRLIKAPHVPSSEPMEDIDARWETCTPKTVGNWSAVGYYFGEALMDELDVPVGLISSNWGGTRIEPWIERADLAEHPMFAERTRALQRGIDEYNAMTDADRKRLEKLQNEVYTRNAATYWKNILEDDPGARGDWMSPDHDDSSWKTMELPGEWEKKDPSLAEFDGIVWFRKTVDLPDAWAGRDLVLSIGRVDDSDQAFFNGTMIGSTTGAHMAVRKYPIPGRMVSGGSCVITVCALDPHGAGGMTGPSIGIHPAGDSDDAIDLDGSWRWHKGVATNAGAPARQQIARNPGMNHQSPGALHDGMIAPFVPYTVRGAIWYQGESNAGQPREYRELMPLLIESWREDFGDHLAFGIVQLAAFKAESDDPNQGGWAHLRDAQLHAARTVPNTGMAVTTDVGDARDIHPRNKKAVGERLAGWALHDVYGVEDAVPSSPIQVSVTRDGGMVSVRFEHVQEGLESANGSRDVGGFALAGPDGRFHWAQARIENKNTVIVWSNEVPEPSIVIYGWQDNPVRADLVNSAGLPASPFRAELSGESS